MKKIFALVCVSSLTVFTACHHQQPRMKKPVIYIYPQHRQKVTVKLDFNGTLQATYPEYKNNWVFMADTDGTLTDLQTGEKFQYLFYEGFSNADFTSYKDGFCVKTDTVVDFLKHKLSYLGLNEKERNDMISYWLPELNAKEYVFTHFRINKACDDVARLNITPKPETEIRIMLDFKPCNEFYEISPQELSPFKRKGFTVVEWGGANLDEILPML